MKKQLLFVGLILCCLFAMSLTQVNAQATFNVQTGTHNSSALISRPPTFNQHPSNELAFNILIVEPGSTTNAEFLIETIEFDIISQMAMSGNLSGTLKIYKFINNSFYQAFSTGANFSGNAVATGNNLDLIHTQPFSNLSYSNAAKEKININAQVKVKNNTGLLVVINLDTWKTSPGMVESFIGFSAPIGVTRSGLYNSSQGLFTNVFNENKIWCKLDLKEYIISSGSSRFR